MSVAKRILVVEDEMIICLDIEDTLSRLGHEVVIATTESDARLALATGRIDLAILDYHLTDGDTTGLAAHLHEAGIPFLVCSGASCLAELGAAFATAQFLPKPFSTEGLLAALSSVGQTAIH